MATPNFLDKRHQKATEKLLEEATPFISGDPKIWIKRVAEDVTSGEEFARNLKARIPLMKGKLRPDVLVFHDFPTSKGLLHVAHTYSGNTLLPVELLMRIDGRIPRAVVLKRGILGAGKWESSMGDENDGEDDFCEYLSELKRGRLNKFKYNANWDLKLGNSKIKLQWAMQLVPLSDDKFLFIFHQPYETAFLGGYSKFGIKKFIELVGWLEEGIHKFGYSGPSPKIELLVPTLSILSISEIVRGRSDTAH